MSVHFIKAINENAKKLKLILDEISESIKSVESSSLKDLQIQVKSVNKSVEEIEKTGVVVPKRLRELKNQLVSDISVLEDLKILKETIIAELDDFINANSSQKPKITAISIRTRVGLPQTIQQTFEVLNQMWKHNFDVAAACQVIARERGVTENSVRANCTRNIKLSTEQLRVLAKNKENLTNHLINIFPRHSEYIIKNIK